ncbi:MAG: guanylate kinase [Phycisphaerales bacterium]|nr:MAG: guanylate kinase [Phycisphaerales bacterium]
MSSSPDGGPTTPRGKVIVISGPSGAGKTSICNALLAQLTDAVWSVSTTTRPMRPGDVEGVTYDFVTEEEFVAQEQAGEFIESAEYVGNRYGTPRRRVEEVLSRGKSIVLEIDVQGGMQIAERMPESIRIFVLPPGTNVLRGRLEGRKTEAQDQLTKRLARADGEIALARQSGCYTHFVVNDVLDDTVQEVRRIIEGKAGKT